jgi:hypothetical protein
VVFGFHNQIRTVNTGTRAPHVGAKPQLTVFPRCRDSDFGGLRGRALRENIVIGVAEQDPFGTGRAKYYLISGDVRHVGTFELASRTIEATAEAFVMYSSLQSQPQLAW